MLLDLSEIARRPGASASRRFSEQMGEEEGVCWVGPVEGRLTVSNAGGLLIVRGRARARVRLNCTRCLEEFELPLEAELEEELPTEAAQRAGVAESEESERAGEDIYREGELNLTELVRQAVLLALPMRAVCEEGCLGICARCGGNRNRGECKCPPEEEAGAGPFASLKELLATREGEGKAPEAGEGN